MEDKALNRRIQFLINEAKSDPPVRDQTGTFALRVITNCFSVGKDVSAREHKKRAPFRSGGALRLASGEDEKPNAEWFNQVTNEQQYTLKRAWEWMLREANTLTVSRVREHLQRWPVVVVTKEECKRLVDLPEVTPGERYRRAGIEVFARNSTGRWERVPPPRLTPVSHSSRSSKEPGVEAGLALTGGAARPERSGLDTRAAWHG